MDSDIASATVKTSHKALPLPTDGLSAYKKSSKKVFGKKMNHVRYIHSRKARP